MRTLEDLLGVQGTLVMPPEAMKDYVFERKLHPDIAVQSRQIEGLREVIIHNGKHVDEVWQNSILGREQAEAMSYNPPKSNESHFYIPSTGRLHIVNPRGVIRLKRDQDLVKALGYFLGREIDLSISHYEGKASKASHRFEHMAFLTVEDALRKVDMSAIARNGRLSLILGPHASLDTSDVTVVNEDMNDYLNYRVLKIGDEAVINFDYIFGDQARNVLHQIYTTLSADMNPVPSIMVFHYGKIGLLNPAFNIGQIVVPTGSLDEDKVLAGEKRVFPLYNELSANGGSRYPQVAELFRRYARQEVKEGITVNTISVLGQTIEDLERNRTAGGDVLDMEWAVMQGTSVASNSTYPGLVGVYYFLAGVGSDRPLLGENLGNTRYADGNERTVANAFKKILMDPEAFSRK